MYHLNAELSLLVALLGLRSDVAEAAKPGNAGEASKRTLSHAMARASSSLDHKSGVPEHNADLVGHIQTSGQLQAVNVKPGEFLSGRANIVYSSNLFDVLAMLSGRNTSLPKTRSKFSTWERGLVLAISSSTDNFAIGLSVALAGSPLSPGVNAIIALCNGLGATVGAMFGSIIESSAPLAAPLIAAGIFLYLAQEEVISWKNAEDCSPLARSAAQGLIWRLALPMSLNNIGGGLASGLIGITPILAGGFALLASYVMMAFGHFLGMRLGKCVENWFDPRLLAAAVFVSIGLAEVHEALMAAS